MVLEKASNLLSHRSNLFLRFHPVSFAIGLPIPVVGLSVGVRHQDYGTDDL